MSLVRQIRPAEREGRRSRWFKRSAPIGTKLNAATTHSSDIVTFRAEGGLFSGPGDAGRAGRPAAVAWGWEHNCVVSILRRIELALLAVLGVVFAGTAGYVVLGFSPLDALYQTVTTITTVGFRE